MAHDEEELDWGEDDGWAAEETAATTMDVDGPADIIPTTADAGESQPALKKGDQPYISETVGPSQEQKPDTSFTQSTTRNGSAQRRDSRRTVSKSSSDFGKSLPPGLPQRPAGSAPHVERSDPLAASAMAPSPSKSTNGLPPDWEERKSRSNGGIYYFNIKTEETTWAKPTLTNGAASTTIAEPLRPDSPTIPRRERERRRPSSPNVSSTLPPLPVGLPARPQFNSSQQRRERSASPPPRARSRERQKEPERDSRGGRGDRRLTGPQARVSPPPRTRDVYMRDPSPEPTRRYRSSSPQVARDRDKAGGNRVYNDRERSPPPIPRGQRPSSPPLRRDDRGPRRPEDRYPLPRNRSRSAGPPRRRSPSPPMRRPRTPPPRARDVRRPSPPPSSSLPQKRRGDTPPPPPARSNVYPDRYDSQRDRDGPEDSQAKRRRVDDDRDLYEGQVDRRDDRYDPRTGEEGRRNPEDSFPSKRPPLPPQDQRFRTAIAKPSRRHQSPSLSPFPSTGPEGRLPSVVNSNSGRNERPQEGQGTRKREGEKIKLPETGPAVAAAYNRRRVSSKDEAPNTVNPDVAGSRDGPTSKLPPSGPGGRLQRSYGPALRDGAPRPTSPEALTGREPPRGPRGAQRSPNTGLRPLSPRRDQSPPRQRSPPRREHSPPRRDPSPPRRPRSPPPNLRTSDRDAPTMDYEMSTRSSDLQMGRRESNRNQERGDRSQFVEAEQRGASHSSRMQYPGNQAPGGPVPRRERGRGRGRKPSPPPVALKTWGQPQSKRSPPSPHENEVYDRDENRNRYGEEPGRNRAPNEDVSYPDPRYNREQEPEEYSQGSEIHRSQDHPRSAPARQPYPPRQVPFDEAQPPEQDVRSFGHTLRPYESSSQFRDGMDLDEDHAWATSARYARDDGQSTRSGLSLEEEYSQRPDPLPEARRLSIWERDDEPFRGDGSRDNRRDFDTASYPAVGENGVSSNRAVRGEPALPPRHPEELPPQARRPRSPSPDSLSYRNIRRHLSSEVSVSHKDATVSSSRSEDFRDTRQTQPRRPTPYEQIGNEDRANGTDDQNRRDTATGRPRIVRRDLSPLSTNGLSVGREPASTQPTPISADSIRDYAEERAGPSAAGQGSGGKGSLLARLSVPGTSGSGERPKGKRDHPGPSPTGGPPASLQARMESGERPAVGRRDTDDGERRRKKPRRGRGGIGGGRNRDVQG